MFRYTLPVTRFYCCAQSCSVKSYIKKIALICILHQKLKNSPISPIGILSIYILHLCILYILVVLQMHDSCWPLCTCHEWQKYSQSFSMGQRKKANKQPCNKREQYVGLTQIPWQVSNLEETRKS